VTPQTVDTFAMKMKFLQQLQEQERLYMEKKHSLALLDLQIKARNANGFNH